MRHPNLIIPIMVLAAGLSLAGGVPLQASPADGRIEAAVKDSYNFKTYLKNDPIKVESANGVVTLTGTVAREDHKALAEETAAGMPGVQQVENKLTLAGNQPQEHSDSWISMKVKMVLSFHKNVKASTTEVNTQDGVVTLTGTADNQAQKDLTAEYAKDVDGVAEVRNRMVVAKTKSAGQKLAEKVDDASITAQIKTTLLFHKSTHTLATKVTTKDGIVTVHGEAQNPS